MTTLGARNPDILKLMSDTIVGWRPQLRRDWGKWLVGSTSRTSKTMEGSFRLSGKVSRDPCYSSGILPIDPSRVRWQNSVADGASPENECTYPFGLSDGVGQEIQGQSCA